MSALIFVLTVVPVLAFLLLPSHRRRFLSMKVTLWLLPSPPAVLLIRPHTVPRFPPLFYPATILNVLMIDDVIHYIVKDKDDVYPIPDGNLVECPATLQMAKEQYPNAKYVLKSPASY